MNGCLEEETKRYNTIAFRAYCLDHKPKNASRRISSEFVRGQVLKANGRKEHQKLSNQLNSDWITKRSKKQFEKQPVNAQNQSEDGKQIHGVGTDQEQQIETNLVELFTPNQMQIQDNAGSSFAVTEITQEIVKSSRKISQNVGKRSIRRSLLDELESVSMWWDTRGLRAENQTEDLLNDQENKNDVSRIGYQDEISKVS